MEKLGRHRNLTEGRERQAAGAEALCVKAVGFPFVPQAWSFCSVQLLPWKLLLWSTELAQSTAFLEEGTYK